MGANFVDPFREGRELEKGGRETRPTRGFHRAGMAAADDAYQLVIDAPDLPAHTCGHAVRRTRAVVRAASALGLIAVLGSLAGYYGGGSHRISELGSLSFGVIASLIPSGPSSVEVPLASLRLRHTPLCLPPRGLQPDLLTAAARPAVPHRCHTSLSSGMARSTRAMG